MTPRLYIVPPAIIAPAALSVVAVILGVRDSHWYFAALPFIWLGSICAQPNMNLVQGCLAYLAMIVGFALLVVFKPLGIAILGGACCGFYLSAIEKRLRMRPVPEDGLSGHGRAERRKEE